jgi:hypothetical protein
VELRTATPRVDKVISIKRLIAVRLLDTIERGLVWLVLLPLRLVGIVVTGAFELLRAVILLPARVLRGPGHV